MTHLASPFVPLCAALGLVLAGAGAAWGQAEDEPEQRRIQLAELRPDGPARALLSALDTALGAREAETAADVLDRLFLMAEGLTGGRLLRDSVDRSLLVPLRQKLLERAVTSSAAVKARLRELQTPAAESARAALPAPLRAELMAQRFPFAKATFQEVEGAFLTAVEAADLPRANALGRFLAQVHPDEPGGPQREQQLMALRLAQQRYAQPPPPPPTATARLRQVAARSLVDRPTRRGLADGGLPPQPVSLGETVCVSDGGAALLFDLEGGPRGQLPGELGFAPPPPGRLTRFVMRPATRREAVFLPLRLEQLAAPARSSMEERNASPRDLTLAGQFWTLAALDPARAKLLWWDGDPGPQPSDLVDLPERGDLGNPPGWEKASEANRKLLAQGHVIAVACDGPRVYAAFLVKDSAIRLYVTAYEVQGSAGGGLRLVPAWRRPTFVLASGRPGRSSLQAVTLELAAALSCDEEGRVFLNTDLDGSSACLAAHSGALLWVRQGRPPRTVSRTNLDGTTTVSAVEIPPPEPALIVRPTGARGNSVLTLSQGKLRQLSAESGRVEQESQEQGTQLLALPGGQQFVVLGPLGLKLYGLRGLSQLSLFGAGGGVPGAGAAVLGPGLVAAPAPLRAFGRRRSSRIEILAIENDGFVKRQTLRLNAESGPLRLAAVAGGLVAASAETAYFFRWQEN